MEKALSVPLTGEEIVEIAVDEMRRRLRSLSPLQGMKEYSGFEIAFNHTVRLFRMPESGGGDKETIAWGRVIHGETGADAIPAGAFVDIAGFKTGTDVNQVRIDHDLPLTVEANDGRGGKARKQVRHKDGKFGTKITSAE